MLEENTPRRFSKQTAACHSAKIHTNDKKITFFESLWRGQGSAEIIPALKEEGKD